jgi:hypothetical protein
MKLARAKLVFLLALTLAGVRPATGQTIASSFAELENTLDGDQTFYVYTDQGTTKHGRLKAQILNVSPSTLQIDDGRHSRTFLESDVVKISERHTNTKKGALIGFITGAVLDLTALHGFQLMHDCRTDRESCSWAKFGFTVMAGGGALIGAQLGHSTVRERIVFLGARHKF